MSHLPIPFATGNVAAPVANTNAVVTFAALAGGRHTIEGIAWSYSGSPTGGNLTITDGNLGTVFNLDVTAAGPGYIPLIPPACGTVNASLVVTLAAGGSGVLGKLTVLGRWTN